MQPDYGSAVIRNFTQPGTSAEEATTAAGKSDKAAKAAECTCADGTISPVTLSGKARVAVAEATTVGRYPISNAPRAVELTHMWDMKPTRMRFSIPLCLSKASSCVWVKELG